MFGKTTIPVFMALLVSAALLSCRSPQKNCEQFVVTLPDPAHPDLPAQSYDVFLNFDKQGFPESYHMKLHTGVCLDGLCNPVTVTLFWNPLGYYSHLECPPGEPLQKTEHEPFSEKDYQQLDAVLKNQWSVLGTKSLEWLVGQTERQKLDAVSGATSTGLAKEAVVQGAAYTTWTLWHWINGEIRNALMEKTMEHCSEDFLRHCLRQDDPRLKKFALSQLENLAKPSRNLWTQIAEDLPQAEAYHDVYHVLMLLQKRAGDSDTVRRNIEKLREHNNRFIGRLAEEYLSGELQ